jgi:transposase-like protein
MRGRVHTREFKLEVCRQVASGEKRLAQICREHELANGVLLRWRKEYEQYGDGAFLPGPKTEREATERRVAELERFCGQLALENAVLKKALQTVRSRSNTR